MTDARLTGTLMVTGVWRLTGEVMLTVLVVMFIWAAMGRGVAGDAAAIHIGGDGSGV